MFGWDRCLMSKQWVYSEPKRHCSRCHGYLWMRINDNPKPSQLTKRYYYSRVYMCRNRKCRTTVVTFDQDRVYPTPDIVIDDDNQTPPWEE